MQELFTSGHAADLVLIVLIVEAALVLTVGRRKLALRRSGYLANLVAGMGLILAFRLALTGAAWPLMVLALLLSMIGHVLDFLDRVRAGTRAAASGG